MHPAPAVTVLCGDGGAWRILRIGLVALTAATLTLWALAWTGWAGAPAALGAALLAVVAAGVGWWRGRQAPAHLCWDQQRWTLRVEPQADAVPGQVTVAIDLGHWLLLRFNPGTGAAVWLPLSARRLAASHGPLRAALYAGRGHDALLDASLGGPP